MAKSKNHTNHNQIRKAHRNGIKKARVATKQEALKHLDPKFARNQKYALRGSQKAVAAAKA